MEIAIFPRWVLCKFYTDFNRQYQLNILLSNILVIAFFLLFKGQIIEWMNLLPHYCLFDKLFRIECPVCGTTRSLTALASGQFEAAYNLNASSVLVGLFFLFQIPIRALALTEKVTATSINRISTIVGRVLIAVIVISWLTKQIIQS